VNAVPTVPELEEALTQIPTLDAHTHLVGGHLGARGLHDILLYHMVVSDLFAAGCPSGKRLTEYPGWPSQDEAHGRIREALPYLRHVSHTSTFWMVRVLLADLYGWREAIEEHNWRRLDDLIRERADDRVWQDSVLQRANIVRTVTEFARREDGSDDHRLEYALEWGFFTRCQWGEFDTALYELERCWGREPEPPSPIGGVRPQFGRVIRGVADVHEATAHYVANIPKMVVATTNHVSTDIDFRVVAESEMAQTIARRDAAGPVERDIYASYINETFLTTLERERPGTVYQFSLGAEPLPFETASRLSQRTIGQLAEIIARHPGVHFQCFLSSRHANQSICTLARELPNLSVAGFWWHNFMAETIHDVLAERLDMLPSNKQVGFFSDAYCVEWTYAKAVMVRRQMARVLAELISQGRCTPDEALGLARELVYETPRTLLKIEPRNDVAWARGV
jgi:hypothetical protein